jgi:predicted enzyme related to lactoylglutathione lyase
MPSANPVNWFEIPATDLDRAQRFYEQALEIEMQRSEMGPLKMAWFPMQPDGDGATGTLVENEAYTPSHAGSMVYFSVPDIEGTLARVEAAGGKVLNPKFDIGEFGFVAHFEDSEGNRVALHSES